MCGRERSSSIHCVRTSCHPPALHAPSLLPISRGGGGASHWWSRASVASVEDQTLGPAAVMYCTWYGTLRRWRAGCRSMHSSDGVARSTLYLLLLPFSPWHRRTAACAALDMTASGHHTGPCRRNGAVPCRLLSHFDHLVRPGRGSFLVGPCPKAPLDVRLARTRAAFGRRDPARPATATRDRPSPEHACAQINTRPELVPS